MSCCGRRGLRGTESAVFPQEPRHWRCPTHVPRACRVPFIILIFPLRDMASFVSPGRVNVHHLGALVVSAAGALGLGGRQKARTERRPIGGAKKDVFSKKTESTNRRGCKSTRHKRKWCIKNFFFSNHEGHREGKRRGW
ncbi:hypothetical protein TW95_gp1357 [Pandoravirus inopinatum]|uniref:Uncharacterized protein n=1 Tax=Pandoravirus inopinatum TaxID=1605721 RepID=A0A0B5JAS8_9VIRU|nr:hypothetical protein TW95_gp1357 [Pandoravirus inopinatum]AJF98091.1 hypothetical protein [Pandoravirus inopinatum]